jgi:predicted nucleotide-binding protein
MKIFYSWQSDLPNATNRGFIEKALENVARDIRNDLSLDIEPVIDRDTAGVSGSPEIVGTIFSKIEQADIFACDISIINGADSLKPSPNPNILVELGYALKALGEKRVIMILNRAFGDVEKLPFDLRTRRVLSYNMPAVQDERAPERRELESSLETAIRAIRPRLSPVTRLHSRVRRRVRCS